MTDAELRRLAEAATKGPWMRLFGERTVYDRLEDGCRGNAIVRTDHSPPQSAEVRDLDYIAAANPATMLALLDRLAAMRALLREAKTTLNTVGQAMPLPVITDLGRRIDAATANEPPK